MANAVTDIENFFAEQNNAWDALAARQKRNGTNCRGRGS